MTEKQAIDLCRVLLKLAVRQAVLRAIPVIEAMRAERATRAGTGEGKRQ